MTVPRAAAAYDRQLKEHPVSEVLLQMWLIGSSNPYELQQSWVFTFLKVFTHTKTK